MGPVLTLPEQHYYFSTISLITWSVAKVAVAKTGNFSRLHKGIAPLDNRATLPILTLP